MMKDVQKAGQAVIFLPDSFNDQLGIPVRQDPGRSDQTHKRHFHLRRAAVRALLQPGNVTAGKSQAGLDGKPQRFPVRLQGLPQVFFIRKKGFQQADGLEEGELVRLLKQTVF